MADLPPCRLRLWKPSFCPFNIKVGKRQEKKWGILFKCLTTHCAHIEILTSLDTNSFLMSLCHFIARRGRHHELLSDCGTLKGEKGSHFPPSIQLLKEHLEKQQIHSASTHQMLLILVVCGRDKYNQSSLP